MKSVDIAIASAKKASMLPESWLGFGEKKISMQELDEDTQVALKLIHEEKQEAFLEFLKEIDLMFNPAGE